MGSAGRPLRALQAAQPTWAYGIAIDDFGTGYSNLAYLRPAAGTRVEARRFLRSEWPPGHHCRRCRPAATRPVNEPIVGTLVELAHGLDLTVTAECVETAGQADRLREIGCDAGQGWYYAKAEPPLSITQRLAAERRR